MVVGWLLILVFYLEYINREDSSVKDEAVSDNSKNYDTLNYNLLGRDLLQQRVRSLTNKAADHRDVSIDSIRSLSIRF